MRSEKEMLDLIINTAKEDDRIRAVIMNGSRVNPNVPKDIFQDFDIVYIVTDVKSFTNDHTWVDRFGERIIMQMPEEMQDPPPSSDGAFIYLMQFTDGNRIDLCLYPIDKIDDMEQDSLSLVILDKDNIIKPFPPPNDSDYVVKPPTAKQFADCINEFLWVSIYVAKGLWRDEIPYAKYMIDGPVRDMYMKMMTWYIGIKTDFKKSAGKSGKYFKNYLEPGEWEQFINTYPDAHVDNIWKSLFTMCDLFHKTAVTISEHFGFNYPIEDESKVIAYLKHVKTLPKDAKVIY